MNLRLIAKVIGLLLSLQSFAMAACALFGVFWPNESSPEANRALLISSILTLIVGLLLYLFGWGKVDRLPRREGIVIVGMGWLACGFFGAFPYLLGAPFLSFTGAIFESFSGLSTTGATVIEDLNDWPRSILLWRSLSQWLGGLGILVLFVALLSSLGVNSKSLFANESSFQMGEVSNSRIRDTALLLWKIYVALTFICAVGLRFLGLEWYDAILHAFTTLATGGFSPHNESVGFYHGFPQEKLIELWIAVFMMLGSMNFLIFVLILRKRWDRLRAEEEGKWLLGLTLASIVGCSALLIAAKTGPSISLALSDGMFTVCSAISTTGFTSHDYSHWPGAAVCLILGCSLLGGCSGSTSGGMKVSRFLVFLKSSHQQVIRAFRPHQVFKVKVNGKSLGSESRAQAIVFIALYLGIILVSTFAVTILEVGTGISLQTAFGSVVGCITSYGPGLDATGPSSNYASFRPSTHLFLSFLMVLGRLELYAILVLIVPVTWKKY